MFGSGCAAPVFLLIGFTSGTQPCLSAQVPHVPQVAPPSGVLVEHGLHTGDPMRSSSTASNLLIVPFSSFSSEPWYRRHLNSIRFVSSDSSGDGQKSPNAIMCHCLAVLIFSLLFLGVIASGMETRGCGIRIGGIGVVAGYALLYLVHALQGLSSFAELGRMTIDCCSCWVFVCMFARNLRGSSACQRAWQLAVSILGRLEMYVRPQKRCQKTVALDVSRRPQMRIQKTVASCHDGGEAALPVLKVRELGRPCSGALHKLGETPTGAQSPGGQRKDPNFWTMLLLHPISFRALH